MTEDEKATVAAIKASEEPKKLKELTKTDTSLRWFVARADFTRISPAMASRAAAVKWAKSFVEAKESRNSRILVMTVTDEFATAVVIQHNKIREGSL